jgi:hypothetical protein
MSASRCSSAAERNLRTRLPTMTLQPCSSSGTTASEMRALRLRGTENSSTMRQLRSAPEICFLAIVHFLGLVQRQRENSLAISYRLLRSLNGVHAANHKRRNFTLRNLFSTRFFIAKHLPFDLGLSLQFGVWDLPEKSHYQPKRKRWKRRVQLKKQNEVVSTVPPISRPPAPARPAAVDACYSPASMAAAAARPFSVT